MVYPTPKAEAMRARHAPRSNQSSARAMSSRYCVNDASGRRNWRRGSALISGKAIA